MGLYQIFLNEKKKLSSVIVGCQPPCKVCVILAWLPDRKEVRGVGRASLFSWFWDTTVNPPKQRVTAQPGLNSQTNKENKKIRSEIFARTNGEKIKLNKVFCRI